MSKKYFMKKPTKKRLYKEHNHQVAIFQWAKLYEKKYPPLVLLNGSLTGVNLDPKVAARAKAAGVKAGFPDINLPVAQGGYLGLYIELKTDKGRASPDQKRVMGMLGAMGHLVVMAKGSEKPIQLIENYLLGKINKPQPKVKVDPGSDDKK